jgi:hypothetical protein
MKIQRCIVDRQSSTGVVAPPRAAQAGASGGSRAEIRLLAAAQCDQRPRTEKFLRTNFPERIWLLFVVLEQSWLKIQKWST